MREMCVLCHRNHESSNWKYGEYVTVEGKKWGWFCGKYFKSSTPEFVPQRIKDDRKANAKSLLQPWRNGELSREYLDTYGNGRIKATDKEIKSAKKTWSDVLPSGWESSK